MSGDWKKIDLAGGGLQSANIKLAGLLKKRKLAFALLALFPLGLHRVYLESQGGAWIFRLFSISLAVFIVLGWTWPAVVISACLFGHVIYDIRWIEDRVATLNKLTRKNVYLRQGASAPIGYKGRYVDGGLEGTIPDPVQDLLNRSDSKQDSSSISSKPEHRPSFANQEALLQELAQRKKHE